MSLICRLRALVFGECGCTYHIFSRVLDELIDDENRRQAAAKTGHKDGNYR